ncbi:MAG: hypothetical protein QM451_06165, partial [Bacillota bacterium]|nr:hypothetical protein [Bacillota bacterium]
PLKFLRQTPPNTFFRLSWPYSKVSLANEINYSQPFFVCDDGMDQELQESIVRKIPVDLRGHSCQAR